MVIAAALLSALGVLAAPPSPGCALQVRAQQAVEVATLCRAGLLDEGNHLVLHPGGFVVLDLPAGEEQVCVSTGGEAVRVAVGPRGVPDDAPGVQCQRSAPPPPDELAGVGPAPALPAAEPVQPTEPDARLPLLVLDLEPLEVPEAVGVVLTSVVAVRLGRHRRLDVTSGAEVAALLERAGRPGAACTGDEAACLLDVAGALGARHVVGGSVSRTDRLLQVSLSLLDSESAEVLSRVDFRTADVVTASQVVPDALHNLLQPLFGGDARALPEPPPQRTFTAPETVKGATVAGVTGGLGSFLGVVAPLACCLGAGFSIAGGPTGGMVAWFVVAPVLALPCGVLGGAVGAGAGDAWGGFDIGWVKLAILAGAAGAAALLIGGAAALISLPVVALGLLPFLLGSTFAALGANLGLYLGIAVAVIVGAAAASVAGVGLGVGFDFLTPLLEPAPDPLGGVEGDDELVHRGDVGPGPAAIASFVQRY